MTPQEAIQSALAQTEYEQKYNILMVDMVKLVDDEHLKAVEVLKNDNSKTLVVAVKKALNKELWVNIVPTESQFYSLIELCKHIIKIEKHNALNRRRKNDSTTDL